MGDLQEAIQQNDKEEIIQLMKFINHLDNSLFDLLFEIGFIHPFKPGEDEEKITTQSIANSIREQLMQNRKYTDHVEETKNPV